MIAAALPARPDNSNARSRLSGAKSTKVTGKSNVKMTAVARKDAPMPLRAAHNALVAAIRGMLTVSAT
jgi:hypothetical protein